MNSPQIGLKVASVLAGLIGLGHLLRVVTQTQVLVAGRIIPLWPSAFVFIICLLLAVWLWRLSLPADRQASAQPPPAKA